MTPANAKCSQALPLPYFPTAPPPFPPSPSMQSRGQYLTLITAKSDSMYKLYRYHFTSSHQHHWATKRKEFQEKGSQKSGMLIFILQFIADLMVWETLTDCTPRRVASPPLISLWIPPCVGCRRLECPPSPIPRTPTVHLQPCPVQASPRRPKQHSITSRDRPDKAEGQCWGGRYMATLTWPAAGTNRGMVGPLRYRLAQYEPRHSPHLAAYNIAQPTEYLLKQRESMCLPLKFVSNIQRSWAEISLVILQEFER